MRTRAATSAFALLLLLILAPLLEAAGCRDHCKLDGDAAPCGDERVTSSAQELEQLGAIESDEPDCPCCRLGSQRIVSGPRQIPRHLQRFGQTTLVSDTHDLRRQHDGRATSRGPPGPSSPPSS